MNHNSVEILQLIIHTSPAKQTSDLKIMESGQKQNVTLNRTNFQMDSNCFTIKDNQEKMNMQSFQESASRKNAALKEENDLFNRISSVQFHNPDKFSSGHASSKQNSDVPSNWLRSIVYFKGNETPNSFQQTDLLSNAASPPQIQPSIDQDKHLNMIVDIPSNHGLPQDPYLTQEMHLNATNDEYSFREQVSANLINFYLLSFGFGCKIQFLTNQIE